MTCDTLEIVIDLEYTELCPVKVPFVAKGPEMAISRYFEVLPWKNR